MNVLVAVSTKHGATRGIADRIGQRLRAGGMTAEVFDVGQVADLSRYDAVVLGSAVYMGSWRRQAVDFVRTNRAALAARPVWLFSSGPLGDDASPVDPRPVVDLRGEIGARDHRQFDGALDPSTLSLPERLVVAAVKSQSKPQHDLAGDFRDWKAIDAWADGIVNALAAERVEARQP